MFITAAERLADLDRSKARLDPARCLHARDKYSACEACFGICPVDAIQPKKPPALIESTCESCYACLPACPTGAYTADDAVPALLTSAARSESDHLEILCAHHPNPEMGAAGSLGIQVRGCLAGLGASSYLSLAALDKESIVARTDACSDCPWAALQVQIEYQISIALGLLELKGRSIELTAAIGAEAPEFRPLWAADNPPLSRRDLFRMASQKSQLAAARTMMQAEIEEGNRPSRERFRTLLALDRLPETNGKESFPMEGLGFANVAVSEVCTACEVCARACPTGALTFENRDDEFFVLALNPRLCIGCEICSHLCAVNAISIDLTPESTVVFGDEPDIVLQEGPLTRCYRCQVLMATSPGRSLCPLCAFRVENPFGSEMPPGLLAQQAAGQSEQTSRASKPEINPKDSKS